MLRFRRKARAGELIFDFDPDPIPIDRPWPPRRRAKGSSTGRTAPIAHSKIASAASPPAPDAARRVYRRAPWGGPTNRGYAASSARKPGMTILTAASGRPGEAGASFRDFARLLRH